MSDFFIFGIDSIFGTSSAKTKPEEMKVQHAASIISIGFTVFVILLCISIDESFGFQTISNSKSNKSKQANSDRITTIQWAKGEPSEEEEVVDLKALNPKFIERNKRWIMIVDDEEEIRLAVGDYLYDQGYQVTACADADSMMDVCANPKPEDETLPAIPDVIVSDIRMPGKDGLELLGMIRANERLARVPVILLTAKAMTKDRIDGYKAGADVYLPKPFDPDELLSIIDNTIQRRKQMSGRNGNLVDLKQEMDDIKQIMKKNSATVVKKTDVFLTDTERDVLELICKGFTNAEIASEQKSTVLAVNQIIQNLYVKTETGTRTELVRWGITTGYVPTRPR